MFRQLAITLSACLILAGCVSMQRAENVYGNKDGVVIEVSNTVIEPQGLNGSNSLGYATGEAAATVLSSGQNIGTGAAIFLVGTTLGLAAEKSARTRVYQLVTFKLDGWDRTEQRLQLKREELDIGDRMRVVKDGDGERVIKVDVAESPFPPEVERPKREWIVVDEVL